jgi:S1-C subfamily serine protease
MEEQMLRREVSAPPSRTWRLALLACASVSGVSLGLSIAALRAPARVVVAVAPAAIRSELPAPVACVDRMVLHATVARDALRTSYEGDAVLRSARIVPAVYAGGPRGFKIYAIRPGSLPAMIGLANGDTLTHIQGVSLVSADAALEAVRLARDAGVVTVDLERHGCPITIVVRVT